MVVFFGSHLPSWGGFSDVLDEAAPVLDDMGVDVLMANVTKHRAFVRKFALRAYPALRVIPAHLPRPFLIPLEWSPNMTAMDLVTAVHSIHAIQHGGWPLESDVLAAVHGQEDPSSRGHVLQAWGQMMRTTWSWQQTRLDILRQLTKSMLNTGQSAVARLLNSNQNTLYSSPLAQLDVRKRDTALAALAVASHFELALEGHDEL
jgi:hypothetical protein